MGRTAPRIDRSRTFNHRSHLHALQQKPLPALVLAQVGLHHLVGGYDLQVLFLHPGEDLFDHAFLHIVYAYAARHIEAGEEDAIAGAIVLHAHAVFAHAQHQLPGFFLIRQLKYVDILGLGRGRLSGHAGAKLPFPDVSLHVLPLLTFNNGVENSVSIIRGKCGCYTADRICDRDTEGLVPGPQARTVAIAEPGEARGAGIALIPTPLPPHPYALSDREGYTTIFAPVIDLEQISKAFLVLFAVIDIVGGIPLILQVRQKAGKIYPARATLVSFAIMVTFLFLGERILSLLGVDVRSFAVAGSLVLFFIALEMILGIKLFKEDQSNPETPGLPSDDPKVYSIVPLAFPVIAGAGTITTVLSLRAEIETLNILIAIVLNMIIVVVVLLLTNRIERMLGRVGLIVLRKAFGIILLAISVKLFTGNITYLFPN